MIKKIIPITILIFIGVVVFFYFQGNDCAKSIGLEFLTICWTMLKVLPCAFILISLFEKWCKQETVIKHLGQNCGAKGYFWALLLGAMTIGGLFVAFPLAYSLHRKGASLKVIFSFLGFAGICRIPMTIFEITSLGVKFTVIRLLVTIPAMLIAGILLGSFLEKRHYQIDE